MSTIRQTLPAKDHQTTKKRPQPDPAVFTCLALLSQAAGDLIRHDIKELLDSMFATGLSEALAAALHDICKYIPSLKKDIQDGLLRMLSQILMKRPYTLPGVPKNLQLNTVSFVSEPSDLQVLYPCMSAMNLELKNLCLKLSDLNKFFKILFAIN